MLSSFTLCIQQCWIPASPIFQLKQRLKTNLNIATRCRNKNISCSMFTVYLSPHMVPSLTDSLSLATSPVSAPRCCCCCCFCCCCCCWCCCCWCWQASSQGASLSTTPRQPLVWGKIRQVLHHHCVENNINFYVKSGNRIQSRLSWGILFLFADHENVKWEHFSSPEQTGERTSFL